MGNSDDGEESKASASADDSTSSKDGATPAPPAPPAANQFQGDMIDYEDDDDDEYYGEEMMIPMGGRLPYVNEGYYDELDFDDYYEEDGVAVNSDSSSSSSSSEENEGAPGADAGATDVQINVEITDKKNQIDIPVENVVEADDVHQKADNDLESSDLGFSENHEHRDEHDYQIGELG